MKDKLTIVDPTPVYNKKRHCTLVKCRCKCGQELYVNKYTLEKGISVRCRACFGKTLIGKSNPNFRGYENIPSWVITRGKRRAKQAGLQWDVDLEFLNSLYIAQKEKCGITGIPISLNEHTASLDRIDSEKGYVRGNVWWVHKDVNIMKNGFELEYFAFICKKVSQRLSKTTEESKFVYGKH